MPRRPANAGSAVTRLRDRDRQQKVCGPVTLCAAAFGGLHGQEVGPAAGAGRVVAAGEDEYGYEYAQRADHVGQAVLQVYAQDEGKPPKVGPRSPA